MNILDSIQSISSVSPLAQFFDPFKQLPPGASTVSDKVDYVYYYIFWVSMFFLVLITLLLVWFAIKYRRKAPTDPMGVGPTHHTGLEVAWSVLPMFLVGYMFWIGIVEYEVMATPPGDAYRVDVSAKQWSWEFTYLNGIRGAELHTYLGQPFSLRMDSEDVLHAFYCPSVRVKRDIVPGRTEWVWFEPRVPPEDMDANGNVTKPFPHQYQIFCAEYCGKDHSRMLAPLFVHENEAAFLAALNKMDVLAVDEQAPWKAGLTMIKRKGCLSCHTLTGNEIASYPSWLTLSQQWGRGEERELTNGTRVKIDKNYVRSSILNPQAEIAAGYSPVMPRSNFKDKREEYIIALIEKLKDLQEGEGRKALEDACKVEGIELK